jgi:hypothetical protein
LPTIEVTFFSLVDRQDERLARAEEVLLHDADQRESTRRRRRNALAAFQRISIAAAEVRG